jgi:hypothetical protein
MSCGLYKLVIGGGIQCKLFHCNRTMLCTNDDIWHWNEQRQLMSFTCLYCVAIGHIIISFEQLGRRSKRLIGIEFQKAINAILGDLRLN